MIVTVCLILIAIAVIFGSDTAAGLIYLAFQLIFLAFIFALVGAGFLLLIAVIS